MLGRMTVLRPLLRIWSQRGAVRKITGRWEKARSGEQIDHRTVDNAMCSLQGGYFESVSSRMHKNNGRGLLKAKITFY